MTVLRQQAVQLVQQIPEDQMPNIIQYLRSLIGKVGFDHSTGNDANISPKLKAFGELEKMVRPMQELDYKKELEDARDEKYGRSD
ncbi:hypothetical protein D7X33_26075 [Butyricicoccus sp. 1XD8-22]|nr:hypothetical protein D7X33_26075 [Butyricicoccus sp. 1XD8-22]